MLFLLVPGDPESGAVYILNRKTGTWYSVDFDDKQYGGYSMSQLEGLVKDYHFLDLVERPGLWQKGLKWWVEAANGRNPSFDRKNLPGYQPTPTSIEKHAVNRSARQ